MLLHSVIPSIKRQIRICRLLGYQEYRFPSKNDKKVLECSEVKNVWSKNLLIVTVIFALFVTFNGFYVISTSLNQVGFGASVVIMMTSGTMFADLMLVLLALRKSMHNK